MRWSYWGDVLAIPFFALLVLYFLKKEELTGEEKLLLAFSAGGLVADTAFVFRLVT